jgi:SAM-dependent methyltransferase
VKRKPPYTGLTYKHELLERHLKFSPHFNVAEIGIGTGYSSFKLVPSVASIAGIDIDGKLIKSLEEYCRGCDGIRFLQANVASESPPEAYRSSMDVVFSIDTLQYTAPPERFMAYIRDLLKPDGTALVCFPNERDKVMEGLVNFKDYDSLLRTIEAGGLRLEYIRAARHTRWFHFITRNLWYRMKKIVYRDHYSGKIFPHVFSDTMAYRMIERKKGANLLIRGYTAIIMALLRAGGIYEYFDTENIYGTYLILRLRKRKAHS